MKKAFALLLALALCLSMCACRKTYRHDGKIIVDSDYFFEYVDENLSLIELTPDNWKSHLTLLEQGKNDAGEAEASLVPQFDGYCYWGLMNPDDLQSNATFEILVDGRENTVTGIRGLLLACRGEEGYSFDHIEMLRCSATLIIIPLPEKWLSTTDGQLSFSHGYSRSLYMTVFGQQPSFNGGENSWIAEHLRQLMKENY